MTRQHRAAAADLTSVRPSVVATDSTEATALVAWSTLAEPGDSTAGALVAMLGAERSLTLVVSAAASTASPGTVAPIVRACVDTGLLATDELVGFGETVRVAVGRWGPRVSRIDVPGVVGRAAEVGAELLLPGDPGWPDRVSDLGLHAPLVLWRRGRAGDRASTVLDRPVLSVVGSRANTLAGAEAAAEITSAAADDGCTVVSGGAYGIDAVAHRVAIAAGVPTVAVLAGGVDQLYPAGHVELLRNVERQGLLLAESPPGTRPTRWRFLARNRLIAALADVVVVVEAGARSGALNTANHAAQLGRTVFAVPGAFSSPASVGCHRLVAEGRAQLAVRPSDPARAALTEHSGGAEHTAAALTSPVEDPEVVRVVDALGRRPIGTSEVARRSGLGLAAATDALALAELQGIVRNGRDGWTVVGRAAGSA